MAEQHDVNVVADTAFLVAAFRAEESARPDALFSDPLAVQLAGERGRAMLERVAHLGEMASWSTVVRTVVIDRLLQQAIEGGVRAVVNLGAGLDTRPYRMELPASLRWVEVDLPAVVEWKTARLEGVPPRCSLERHGLDLVDVAARRSLLERVTVEEPTLVLLEGVLPYLAEADVAQLVDDLTSMRGVRYLVVDYLPVEVVTLRQGAAGSRLHDIPLQFAPKDWHGFFATHGWKVATMRDLAEEGRRMGRPFPRPALAAAPGGPRPSGAFVGYALLERA